MRQNVIAKNKNVIANQKNSNYSEETNVIVIVSSLNKLFPSLKRGKIHNTKVLNADG